MSSWNPLPVFFLLALSSPTLAQTAAPPEAPAPLVPAVPEVEPPPAPLVVEAAPATVAPTTNLVETYLSRAARYFKEKDYDHAADELKKAYLIKPKPLFLFNTAQALRRGGRVREALLTYQEFLLKDPTTQLKAETDGYIGDLKAILAEQERVEKTKQALVEQTQTTEQTRSALLDAQKKAERERKKPIYRRGGFWVGMAAIAVAVGAGVTVAVILTRDPRTDGGIIPLRTPLVQVRF